MRAIGSSIALVALVLSSYRADAETLTVKVSGFEGSSGSLQVMVWKDASGFPMQPEKAIKHRTLPVTAPHMIVTFTGLSRGVYAIAAFQDVNNNGKLDRSVLGWPVEPVGASNGATGVVGPPKFADAAFELKQANQTIEVKLK